MMDKDDGIKRVRELLNAYGANRTRWPEGSANGDLAPRKDLGEAQVLFQEALALDELLDEAALPEPSLELTADILANTSPNPWQQWLAILWPFGPVWKPASSLAMAMVIGLYVGTLAPASISDDVLTAELDTLIAGPNYTIEEQ
jgi:hypothetical protein